MRQSMAESIVRMGSLPKFSDMRVCPLLQSLSFSAFLFFTYRNSGVMKPASKKWRSVVNTVCRRISLIITMLEQSTNE